jgi:hypothetical protein
MKAFANHQMSHDSDKFHQSLCVPDQMRLLCRERIFFVSFSHALWRKDYIEDTAPKEFSTMSGDLQRTLRMISDPLEYEFTLLIFMHYQQMCQDATGYYNFLQESEQDPELKAKVEILKMLQKMKADEEGSSEPLIDQLNRDTLAKRIDMVGQSKHSFADYLNILNNWAGTEINVKRKTEYADNLLNNMSFDEE